MVKNLPEMWKSQVGSLAWEDPLQEGMAIHSSILAERIPMDRGAWWATVHGVTKESDTAWQLNNGETKVQRDQITCQGHAANEQQRLDMTELLTQFTAEETSNVKKLGSNLIRLILCS